MTVPIGRREELRLELLSAESLGDLPAIGREVVAMLNAAGGEVWIGLAEEDGRAFSEEPVDDAGLQVRRLTDFLIDAIEPTPRSDEVTVDSVDCATREGQVLTVRIDPARERRPFALRRGKGARHYWIRVADRVRDMTRAELEQAFLETSDSEDELSLEIKGLEEHRTESLGRAEPSFVMETRVVPRCELEEHASEIEELLTQPHLSGNRPAGWTFLNRYAQLAPQVGGWTLEGPAHHLRVGFDGGIGLSLPLLRFLHGNDGQELYSLALLEFPTSVLRLQAQLLRLEPTAHAKVLTRLDLQALKGWSLAPWSPRSYGQFLEHESPRTYGPDSDLLVPVRCWGAEDVLENPDRCSLRLIDTVYRAFGWEEEHVPIEFDRTTGKLVIGE